MYEKTIINPKTNKKNLVRTWKVNPREILNQIKSGKIKSARDISLMLLSDNESIQLMENEQYGDCSNNNFALSVFENALDWTIGMAILQLINQAAKLKKIPKPFEVAVNKSGDVFLILVTGKVIAYN